MELFLGGVDFNPPFKERGLTAALRLFNYSWGPLAPPPLLPDSSTTPPGGGWKYEGGNLRNIDSGLGFEKGSVYDYAPGVIKFSLDVRSSYLWMQI